MIRNFVVDQINESISKFGINKNGKPLFRVVFSDDQLEHRKGIFDIYSGGIWLRTEEGVKELPKYPLIRQKWILERWAPRELTYHPDIVSARDGDYICIYIFQDKYENYLDPLLRVAQIVIKAVTETKSAKELEDEKARKFEIEDAKEEDKILEDIQTIRDEKLTRDIKSEKEEGFVAVSDHVKHINNSPLIHKGE